MVQSVIDIGEYEDRVINVVKARYGLKNKSEAVALLTKVYAETFLEPELQPEYVERLKRKEKEKGIAFENIGELRAIIEG